jgi:ribosomal protein S27E
VPNKDGIVNKRIEKLNTISKDILNEFLQCYSSNHSISDYKSAISVMFDEILEKNDACSITYQDYLKIVNSTSINENPKKYMLSFIRYIYTFDFINGIEFDKIYNKEQNKKHFINQKNRAKGKSTVSQIKEDDTNDNPLTYDKIMKITELLKEKETSSNAMMKYSFYWYLLFELDIDVNKINQVRLDKDFDGSYLKLDGYIQNDKYIDLLKVLSEHKYGNKTKKLNVYETKRLGELVGIENLKPADIHDTRNNFMIIKCPRCLKPVLNFSENWCSYANILVCKNCGEILKKNGNQVDMLDDHEIKLLSEEEKDEREIISQTYDEIRCKMKEIDYLKIHKWNIEIGKLGEAFVYDLECKRLFETKWANDVDKNKALDAKNGYDILSYDEDGSEIYIEVKATAGKEDNDFFISVTELETARKFYNENKKYYIYRVFNILAKEKEDISYTVYKNIFDSDKISMIPESYRIQTVN